ncbi:MAG: hypothetical protein MUO63_00415 [Desulfobulbaceae bacterium]|nr:hypothetical protein [Desulfobulbaceae bacterium]
MSEDPTPTPPSANGGANSASCTASGCPCPTDFVVDAPCKIIKAGGGSVQMSATNLPDFSGGDFEWTTTSTKIHLTNPGSPTVTVEGLADPSASRDAETITVTRTADGCSPIVKTINVTVAKVTFSAATTQRYGYDNFDTPANPLDDHVCIKKSDHTFLKVDIAGGALGTDFDFICDDTDICTTVAPGGTASFDLRLNAGTTNKDDTTLHAKVKCPGATSFTNIQVHVYKEKVVEVVVAKIDHPTTTNLRFATENYSAFNTTVNDKIKEGVAKYNISNFDAGNAITPVTFASGTGVLSYDITNGGGADLTAIGTAMTGTGTKVRVAIVRDMKSYYYLSAATVVGATTLTVRGASTFYSPGDTAPIGTGASRETVTIVSLAGNTITCNALTKAHAVGDFMEFPAIGWSSDPILVVEGTLSLSDIKWTIAHEVGHRDTALDLVDVNEASNVMYSTLPYTDYRLRYCPRAKTYEAGTENQWETIPR